MTFAGPERDRRLRRGLRHHAAGNWTGYALGREGKETGNALRHEDRLLPRSKLCGTPHRAAKWVSSLRSIFSTFGLWLDDGITGRFSSLPKKLSNIEPLSPLPSGLSFLILVTLCFLYGNRAVRAKKAQIHRHVCLQVPSQREEILTKYAFHWSQRAGTLSSIQTTCTWIVKVNCFAEDI